MSSIKPLLFVIMPFGKKMDSNNKHEIDFDRLYDTAIKPAAEILDLEVIRADEERTGGIIHIPMFERLLLAEFVVADLTIPNPNVFYELGVRHCARPRTTLLIYAKESKLPFDVHMLRAIPYQLEEGFLSDDSAAKFKTEIEEKLGEAKKDLETTDSPLFQLISKFPGINLPHEITESFRDRARYIENIRDQLEEARLIKDKSEAIERLHEIECSLGDLTTAHSELLVDLLLSYRDVEAYDGMIELVEHLPRPIYDLTTIQEQYAFALNRRNNTSDRDRAIKILHKTIDGHGDSPETCGILGRIYKDAYEEELKKSGPDKASVYLNEAINWYQRGFESDPRDYYPGVNAVTLLYVKGDEDSLAKSQRLAPAVSFAVARRGGISSRDYWDVATVLELAVLGEDWDHANRALSRFTILSAPNWNLKTTLNNLWIIRQIRSNRDLANDQLDLIIKKLDDSST